MLTAHGQSARSDAQRRKSLIPTAKGTGPSVYLNRLDSRRVSKTHINALFQSHRCGDRDGKV